VQLSVTPFKHQIDGLKEALRNQRYGLFDEPGVGKTLPAQAYALYMAGIGNRTVIVMPPVLLEQFKESLETTFINYAKYVTYYTVDDGPDVRIGKIGEWYLNNSWPHILGMSYQMFIKLFFPGTLALQAMKLERNTRRPPDAIDPEAVKKYHRDVKRLESIKREQSALNLLAQADYNVLVADEAHALKHPSSLQHKAAVHFMGDTKRGPGQESACVLMTGTPIPNTLLDAYGLIKILTPTSYGSKATFERLHAIYTMHGKFQKLIGFKNKELITMRLYSSARRITKDQVFSLDKPIITELPIVLNYKHQQLYQKLVRERVLEVNGKLIDAVQAQSLRMKCLQIVTTPEEFTEDTKLDNSVKAALVELVDDLGVRNNELGVSSNEKVVVFANFRKSVEAIASWFPDLYPALIYGGQSNHDKERNRFLSDSRCRMLIANPRAGGVGLNLQSVCRYVIFAEPTSVPGEFRQASERVYRAGQTRVVSMWILKALGTISPKLTTAMLQKERDIVETMLDKESILNELLGG
jgi:SNF2 family DNA or RNA helicase